MSSASAPLLIAGGGLAGTLVGLELERRGIPFRIADVGKGAAASRVAAGLLNPLIGPRLSVPDFDWSLLEPHYRELEKRLDVGLGGIFHPIIVRRPAGLSAAELRGNGWYALKTQFHPGHGWREKSGREVWEIHGAAWVDVPALIDAAHEHFRSQGILEARWIDHMTAAKSDQRIIWCEGASVFGDGAGHVHSTHSDPARTHPHHPWAARPWQAVAGDVLTVHVPGWDFQGAWIAGHFVIALGDDLFRVGATHEHDCYRLTPRTESRAELETFLSGLTDLPFTVLKHEAGVRPSTRNYLPLVERHTVHTSWFLFNGFAGRGASRMPALLPRLMELLEK